MSSNIESIVFSGIQPSGLLTLGNYCGTMQLWCSLQEKFKCFFCISDLHAFTSFSTTNNFFLHKNILDLLALYLACGVNPQNSIIFVQSHVYEHSVLYWILGNYTYFGELSRMTQFKEKSGSSEYKRSLSLFSYPVLMASDILLYKTNYVPVGFDQKQHFELVKKIAIRFNKLYGNIFTIPKLLIPKVGYKIMSLQNPLKKMSKSNYDQKGTIYLLDSMKSVSLKIEAAVTDSEYPSNIKYDIVNKPGISNLLMIFSSISGQEISLLESKFEKYTYSVFKKELIDVVTDFLLKLQTSYFYLRKNEDYLNKILKEGAEKASKQSKLILSKIFNVLY